MDTQAIAKALLALLAVAVVVAIILYKRSQRRGRAGSLRVDLFRRPPPSDE